MKNIPDKITDDLLKASVAYIRAAGWIPVVIGGTSIRQQPDAAKYNFEFVIQFTGSRKENA